jgi:N-acetyl-anhydromuramyl-L-alanine amidase AmpD
VTGIRFSYGNRPTIIICHSAGLPDVGRYHYTLSPVGRIIRGRPESAIAEHCPSWDSRSIAVCFAGAFDVAPMPEAQLEAFVALRKHIASRHGDLPLLAHSATCPGALFPWIEARRPIAVASPIRSLGARWLVPLWRGDPIGEHRPLRADARVLAWQRKMRDRGWDLVVDGKFGTSSARALVAFQEEKRAEGWCDSRGRLLEADGVLGPQSWEAAWTAPVTGRSLS